MLLTEKIVNTDKYAGTCDLITGMEEDFNSQVEYDDLFHTYTLNGEIIPSVTTLLDDGSYTDVPKDLLENAQIKGTLVHKELENYWNDKEIGFTTEFGEFMRLYNDNKDLFNELCVWDYKTYNYNSKDKREKCYKQLSMYADAIEYLTGIKITKKREIWLPHGKPGKIFDLEKEFGGETV